MEKMYSHILFTFPDQQTAESDKNFSFSDVNLGCLQKWVNSIYPVLNMLIALEQTKHMQSLLAKNLLDSVANLPLIKYNKSKGCILLLVIGVKALLQVSWWLSIDSRRSRSLDENKETAAYDAPQSQSHSLCTSVP